MLACRHLRVTSSRLTEDIGRRVGQGLAALVQTASEMGLASTAPGTSLPHEADELAWHQIEIDGRTVSYGRGGTGPTVVFLHGWGLGSRSYQRSLRLLVQTGCHVIAPAMPGFGGSAPMPQAAMTMENYGDWVRAFLDALRCEEPVVVIGHSFGGGVGAMFAHRHPDSVRYLVLLNAVGGATWDGRAGHSMADRPLRHWVRSFAEDLSPLRDGSASTIRAIHQDLVGNLLRNPLVLWEAGRIARRADLTGELLDLQAADIPVLALTSEQDNVIPAPAFDELCNSLGAEGRTVPGGHSWVLADPDHFAEVMANVLEVEVADHRATTAAEAAELIREITKDTTLPARTVKRLVETAPPLWLTSDTPGTLAADLVLCHPRLQAGEVRAVATPVADSALYRLTVVAADRTGLLADTCAVLADRSLDVVSASAMTSGRLALHSLVVDPGGPIDTARLDDLGDRLRTMRDHPPTPEVGPMGDARVSVSGSPSQRATLTVEAEDRTGLLWTICRWLADHDVVIETVHASTHGGTVSDTFIVRGDLDAGALAAFLRSPVAVPA